MKKLTTFFLTMLLFTLGASAQVVHECEAVFEDWSISGNSGGSFQLNTWSTEADASGLKTPFIEYWVGSSKVLSNATISHSELTDLSNGYYTVSIFARAFNEGSSTKVSEGITFTANGESVDLTTGTTGSYNGSAEVYGTYTLLAEVTAGTLNIGFTVQGLTACDWMAFKNLTVTYLGTTATLEYVTGEMNAEVEAAMKAAVDAWNNSLTDIDLFDAAEAALQAAEASVEQYAEVAAVVANLDAAGAEVWAESASGQAYAAKTLATSDDFSSDMVAAQLAQVTAGSDMSYALSYTGSWTNGVGASNFQNCPSLPSAHEIWSASNFTGSESNPVPALYKTITGLPEGTYTLSFYASAQQGSGTSALAYANNAETQEVLLESYDMTQGWNEDHLYTFTVDVDEEGTLEFGLMSKGEGAWYIVEEGSLTMLTGEEPATEEVEGDYLVMNSGLYFGTGLTNGRQVTLLKNPMYVGFEKQDDGSYRLDSYEYNWGDGEGQHYFGSSRSVAGICSFASTVYNWAVEKQADGTYTIYCTNSGSQGYLTAHGEQVAASLESEPSEGSYWTLITKDEFIASIPDAEKPVDVSALIDFPDFKTYSNEGDGEEERSPAWEILEGDIYVGYDGNVEYFGNAAESYWEYFDIAQVVTLPYAGTYTLTGQGFYRVDGSYFEQPYMYVTANGETQELAFPALEETSSINHLDAAAEAFYDGLYPLGTIVVEAPADNTDITIGFKGGEESQWVTFSQVVLTYYADEPVPEPTPEPTPEPEVVHECVAELSHWTTDGTTEIAYNTWSVEEDASGMVAPFLQLWVWGLDATQPSLEAATVSHETLTDLEPGSYEVSLDIRIYSEVGNEIGEGTTFNANGESADLVLEGNEATNSTDDYEHETLVYGTYVLTCTVGEVGTLDISINIPEGVDYNWIAWKNLTVTYVGEAEPEPTPEPTEPEDIHECVAEFDHWSIAGNSGGSFQLNTWSTENDASGMVTPFIEYWVGSGNQLSDATISHETLTDLEEGYYSVSIFGRAFNEKTLVDVAEGTIFLNANEESVDVTTGTVGVYDGVSAEVYGTYTLLVYVTSGTLDINFSIAGTNCDWFAFKNLSVTYFGVEMPTLAAVTGVMNVDVEAAMNAAVAAYNDNKNAETYYAAMEAIEAAETSVEYYAPIVAAVDGLDDAGAAVWATSQYAAPLTARTLTNEDVGTDLAAAQKAQVTNGSDMGYVAVYDGTWIGNTGTYLTGVERYGDEIEVTGSEPVKVLYKQIEKLTPGTYTVTFYAVANNAWVGAAYGDGIAQVFADETTEAVTVYDQTSFTDLTVYTHTLTCEVDSYGVLEFGLQNVATGGNWYVAQAVGLTLDVVNTDIPTSIDTVETAVPVEDGAIYDLSGRKVAKAVKGVYIINGKKVLVK